jgi:hypothetical protein
MEDVLDLYATPYNPRRPKICLDEKMVYLLTTPRGKLLRRQGRAEKEDYEYHREGSCNLFVMVEPQAGYRHIIVRQRRTNADYAYALKWLVDEGYPDAEEIEVVQDNLNIHGPGALYATFEPQEALRILRKLRFHYTPKHGSWLNMAEIEISVFERQCLSRRIGTQAELEQQVAALETERNASKAHINWQFTCEKARETLHRLYPKLT